MVIKSTVIVVFVTILNSLHIAHPLVTFTWKNSHIPLSLENHPFFPFSAQKHTLLSCWQN